MARPTSRATALPASSRLLAVVVAAASTLGCTGGPAAGGPSPTGAHGVSTSDVPDPGSMTSGPEARSDTSPQHHLTPSPSDDGGEIERVVASMSDEQLIGHLLVLHVHGGDGSDVTADQAAANLALYGARTPAEVVREYQPAGIILIGRNPQDSDRARLPTGNTEDAGSVAGFVDELQRAADIPLLVAADQEHGPVVRLDGPFVTFPSAMAMGATDDPELVRRAAAAIGEQMAAAGINVDLAPVADVNTEPANPVIGIRSPGFDPTTVAGVVTSQIEGLHEAGIAATAKHFPGHGNTTTDSHTSLPTVDTSRRELQGEALVPFRAAVEADVDLVMPGHLLVPALDPAAPSTLSREALTGLLRQRMGFEGAIITDSLWMGAIRTGDDPDTARRALEAGNDLLLMPPSPAAVRDALVGQLADGVLDREMVETSVSRTLALKMDLGLLGTTPARGEALDDDVIASHAQLAREVGSAAVTLHRGVCPAPLRETGFSVVGEKAGLLLSFLEELGLAAMPARGDVTIRLWDGDGAPPVTTGPTILVVVGDPYAAGRARDADTVLVTYGDVDSSLAGLADALASGTITGRDMTGTADTTTAECGASTTTPSG